MPSNEHVRRGAIRLLAIGVGTATAGPLGAALGGFLGGLFSQQAAKLLEDYLHSSGEALTEFGVHHLYDQLCERKEHPPLEAVAQEALRRALAEVRAKKDVTLPEAYAAWFANWDWRLRSAERFDSLSEIVGGAATPDSVFRRVMERLDGEARALHAHDKGGGVSITAPDSFRTMPDDLLDLLANQLPGPLQANFDALVALPQHSAAWVAVQQSFQAHVLAGISQILEILKQAPAPLPHRADSTEANGQDEGSATVADGTEAFPMTIVGSALLFKVKWTEPPYTTLTLHVDQPLFEKYPGDWFYRDGAKRACPQFYALLFSCPGIRSVMRVSPYELLMGKAELARYDVVAAYISDALKTETGIRDISCADAPAPAANASGSPGVPAQKTVEPTASGSPQHRDANRAERNQRLVEALKAHEGVRRCEVFQLEDHTDKGYLIDVEFEPQRTSAAIVVALVRQTLDEMVPHVPFWGQTMTESSHHVSFGYSYIDEHNRVFTEARKTATGIQAIPGADAPAPAVGASGPPGVPAPKTVQPTAYTDGDWITAAIVARERAETEMKRVASRVSKRLRTDEPATEPAGMIEEVLQSRIKELLEKHAQGGTTDDTRLEACIAKVVADILASELAEFQWAADERSVDHPVLVFRDTIKSLRTRYR